MVLEDYFSQDADQELAQIQQRVALARNNEKLVTNSRDIEDMAQTGQVSQLYIDYQQVSSSNVSLDSAIKTLVQQEVPITVLNEGRVVLDQAFSAVLR